MARNVEIKVRLAEPTPALKLARSLSGKAPLVLEQEDLFFKAREGRLKIRFMPRRPAELIHYVRPDKGGSKLCHYDILKMPEAEGRKLAGMLNAALGPGPRVIKLRKVFLYKRTRIHFDKVRGLGSFLELEAVLGARESAASGRKRLRFILGKLSLEKARRIPVAYADLRG